MGRAWMGLIMLLGGWAVAQTLVSAPAQAQLDPYYYVDACPDVFPIVARDMLAAIQNESRVAASLMRMHFHDCFVQGCDASILLDGPNTEKTTIPNKFSVRRYDVIDTIKADLEEACPNVVSCADTIALASFFGIILSGGPIWVIPLGRRDSLTPNPALTSQLPPPNSNITLLKNDFINIQGLSVTDLVALSGGHTIGDARCITITNPGVFDRLYNLSTPDNSDTQLNSTYLAALQQICPFNGDGNITTGLDLGTPRTFDNSYFIKFLTHDELLISDSSLYRDDTEDSQDTRELVLTYAANQTQFFIDFAQSMINMGNLNVSTGTAGEVRTNCTVPNSNSIRNIQTSRQDKESTPTKVPKELSDEEKGKFVDDIRKVVERVKEEYLAEVLQRLVEDGVVSSSHSSF